ncbi:shikimate 5-dehydrogenase [Tersicoccus solisilvae]|uniref:shikimate dehydrogenase (NADP(+)) n=1 Tax=Tersicoccus solisilvae TaxID=1882339 RepID=A0ABQ1NKG2_9MICC|nr:shikimate 5-dehydrogenase [Tersicoccus solisilvae]GGC79458.1 shikimate 5-dehydrogenase [Tersicoccus solisilvae]
MSENPAAHARPLTKDTRLCISLAARPSNHGTRFHNWLYNELGLDFVYKAMTTTDITAAIGGVRALGIRGCSVSMPFKEAVIPLVDAMDASATAIDSVNTIVNDDGKLTAYNTDYLAIASLLASRAVDPASSVLLRGSGGMAKAVIAAFADAGFTDVTILARNADAGSALASRYGFAHRVSADAADSADARADVVVNVTPVGMAGKDAGALSFDLAVIDAATVVFDVVAMPALTPLVAAGQAAGKTVITGGEVIALQAAAQFELYTGARPTPEQVAAAEDYAAAG